METAPTATAKSKPPIWDRPATNAAATHRHRKGSGDTPLRWARRKYAREPRESADRGTIAEAWETAPPTE